MRFPEWNNRFAGGIIIIRKPAHFFQLTFCIIVFINLQACFALLLKGIGFFHPPVMINKSINQFHLQLLIWFFSKTLCITEGKNTFIISYYPDLSPVP